MTKQFPDTILYSGEEYELLGDSSRSLPMLNQFGIEPTMMSTGCYRGYVAEYTISGENLYLSSLTVQDAKNNYPVISGVRPTVDRFGQPIYVGLHELMSITGSITIGKGKPENWPYPDIRSVHDFNHVLKLTLRDGTLQSVTDISEVSAAIRSELREIYPSPEDSGGLRQFKRNHLSDRTKMLMDQSWSLRYSEDAE